MTNQENALENLQEKCLGTAYVAGFAVLNLQKNDAKYEASVLQQSRFLAYSRMQQRGVLNSTKIHQFDQKTEVPDLDNRIYCLAPIPVWKWVLCCTDRRGIGARFYGQGLWGDMRSQVCRPWTMVTPHHVEHRVTLSHNLMLCTSSY